MEITLNFINRKFVLDLLDSTLVKDVILTGHLVNFWRMPNQKQIICFVWPNTNDILIGVR